jgi:hypothetical protein
VYPSPIRSIKSRRLRWARHVAGMGDEKYNILVGRPEGERLLGKPRWKIILEWILGK